MEIDVREPHARTSWVIDRVRSGERVTLTVDGERVADIVPHEQRTRWLSGAWLREELADRAADPGLTDELADLAGRACEAAIETAGPRADSSATLGSRPLPSDGPV